MFGGVGCKRKTPHKGEVSWSEVEPSHTKHSLVSSAVLCTICTSCTSGASSYKTLSAKLSDATYCTALYSSVVYPNSWSEVEPSHIKTLYLQRSVLFCIVHITLYYLCISTAGQRWCLLIQNTLQSSLQCYVLLKNLLQVLHCRLQYCAFQQLVRGGASCAS